MRLEIFSHVGFMEKKVDFMRKIVGVCVQWISQWDLVIIKLVSWSTFIVYILYMYQIKLYFEFLLEFI